MRDRGFTLVEVMVAVAVAALLITGVSAATNGVVNAAARRKAEAKEAERLSRAMELLRDDWRGRVRVVKPDPAPPAGTTVLILATTSDSVSPAARRSARLVTYVACEKGLRRREGSSEVLLIDKSCGLEFWDGASWHIGAKGGEHVLRITLEGIRQPYTVQ